MVQFYTVTYRYLEYLKSIDSKVPNYEYSDHDKFYFGILFEIGDMKYFAPISSKKEDNATSLPIKEQCGNKLKQIASIRLSFMIPVPDSELDKVDIEWLRLTKGANYADFVAKEYNFCKSNFERISRRAKRVYNFGIDKTSKYNKFCCDFKLLEIAYKEWIKREE